MFKADSLVPKPVCDYFINVMENNLDLSIKENSYKYDTEKNEYDNYSSLDISALSEDFKSFVEPRDIARKFLGIMITNYVLHMQRTICPSFSSKFINSTHNIRILKYEKGQYIRDHTDVDANIRASCTLNLNEDYEGGEFRFFDGKIKETLKTGDGLFFPAEPIWIHGTEPVTKGIRYSINCFLYSADAVQP